MIHTYDTINNPLSQIEAAEEFCESVHAYVQDEYQDVNGVRPPDVYDVNAQNVLDVLARLGLRFETDGTCDSEDDAYFALKSRKRRIDECLHGYARSVAQEFEENGFVEYPSRSKKHRDTFELIKLNGCASCRFVFVPDYDGVASAAYFLLLTPGEVRIAPADGPPPGTELQ